jgi:hypothetical protein
MILKNEKKKLINVDANKIYNYYNESKLIVEKIDKSYSIEIDNKVFTTDPIEAISYVLRVNNYANEEFWNNKMIRTSNKNISDILYYLSGGDDFWKSKQPLKEWKDVVELFLDNYSTSVKKLYRCKTFKEIRNKIIKEYNLDIFYDFMIKNQLIK